ncbi:MAG: TolC family protein [Flavobacteriales bacterium]|nr:TolC family protein [Flavobacteriales bacterium]
MKPSKFILTLSCVFALSAYGQQSMTLKDALDYGMKNNYSVKMSQADMEKSEKKVREVLAIGLPQINASGQFMNYLNLPTTVVPANAFNPSAPADQLIGLKFGTDYNVTGSVTASQLLFDGSYLVGLQATKNLANLSRLNVERTQREAQAEISKAYYTAVVADENVKTLENTVALMEKLLNETKAVFQNGLTESQDVDQIQLTVTNLKNALSRAKLMKDASIMSLKLQMGMPLEQELVIGENTDAIIGSVGLEQISLEGFDPSGNVDYQMLATQVKLNELNMQNEKMKYYPSLNAFFTHQYQAFRNDFDFFKDKPWYPATFWGVQMQIPIFSSGMRNAKVAQTRIEMEKSEINLQEIDQALKIQSYLARTEYVTSLDAFKLQKESLALAESIQNKTLIKYKQGLASSMELTTAQNQYLTQQANYISALFNLLSAKVGLDKINSKTQPSTTK